MAPLALDVAHGHATGTGLGTAEALGGRAARAGQLRLEARTADPDLGEAELLGRLRALVEAGHIGLTVDRRKLSHIDFPLALEADGNRWLYPLAALTALAFWRLGVVAGAVMGVTGVLIYQTLGRAFVVRRLERRIRDRALLSIETWRKLWRFGGVILTEPTGATCQGPEASWMALVRAFGSHDGSS